MKINQARLLTDENISPKVVAHLRHMGFDVLDSKEKLWQGTEDEELINRALLEQRFILTHDSDFGTLAINQGTPCYGILYLRLKNLKSTNVIRACESVFQLDVEIHPHTIWVIEDTRIRIRYLVDDDEE
jgi:predicted nuclease of predicted toxin-antitoxin system